MQARSLVPAFIFDAILICVFAALGRSSHTLEMTTLGMLITAWPFLVGLALTWMIAMVWKAPLAPLRAGLPLWVGTTGIGLGLRALTGGGVALPFILVATGTIGVLLVGWRAATAAIRAAQRKTPQR